jgi:hypothetical protein
VQAMLKVGDGGGFGGKHLAAAGDETVRRRHGGHSLQCRARRLLRRRSG